MVDTYTSKVGEKGGKRWTHPLYLQKNLSASPPPPPPTHLPQEKNKIKILIPKTNLHCTPTHIYIRFWKILQSIYFFFVEMSP